MYCVWPDGTWCPIEFLEEYLTFMSDDYYVTDICPDDDLFRYLGVILR